jgi:uncharacterized protein (DUF305 family)
MNRFFRLNTLCALAVGLILTGCSSNDMSAESHTTPANTTAPAPGSTVSISSIGTTPQSGNHNASDVTFAQMMIVHHQGAIEMADLVQDRAGSQQVKDLGVKIKAAQAPEIELMGGWLKTWGQTLGAVTSSAGAMDHGGMSMGTAGSSSTSPSMMPGMMTENEMAALRAASGSAFDKMFLQSMIEHHRGALQMAETELAQGINPDARALAERIKTSQTAEIAEMQQLAVSL